MLDWLNPWWKQTYAMPVPLEPRYVEGRFQTETTARVSRQREGRLVVARRGRYLGGYLRTVATLTPNESNTEVGVTFARPESAIWLMVGFSLVGILVTLVESVPLVSPWLAGTWNWSDLVVLIPIVSVCIIFAANHYSATADREYLLGEIWIALTQPPRNYWRTLAEQL